MCQCERILFKKWPVVKWLYNPLLLSPPQVPPLFPSLVISPGAGIATACRAVPMRLKQHACLSSFSLFFLLEVEHHRGVRFCAINCHLIPKEGSETGSQAWCRENTEDCILSGICSAHACTFSYMHQTLTCVYANIPATLCLCVHACLCVVFKLTIKVYLLILCTTY